MLAKRARAANVVIKTGPIVLTRPTRVLGDGPKVATKNKAKPLMLVHNRPQTNSMVPTLAALYPHRPHPKATSEGTGTWKGYLSHQTLVQEVLWDCGLHLSIVVGGNSIQYSWVTTSNVHRAVCQCQSQWGGAPTRQGIARSPGTDVKFPLFDRQELLVPGITSSTYPSSLLLLFSSTHPPPVRYSLELLLLARSRLRRVHHGFVHHFLLLFLSFLQLTLFSPDALGFAPLLSKVRLPSLAAPAATPHLCPVFAGSTPLTPFARPCPLAPLSSSLPCSSPPCPCCPEMDLVPELKADPKL